jgi:tRNA-dihydrouridine synthase A
MMDITDRHFRYWMRCITKDMVLYTEMVTTGAILHGQAERFLAYHPTEHPVALQLGGSDPRDLAECSKIGEAFGYDEINLNVGCPSDRVQEGRIGACLMAEPKLVSECVQAMLEATKIPVTVKTRLGIDDRDSYEELCDFVHEVSKSGCRYFTLHARKAWLKGLSPKQNRDVPPLCYDWVYRFKREHPHLWIELNGGVKTLTQVQMHLEYVDSVMLGRLCHDQPWECQAFDRQFGSGVDCVISRLQALRAYEQHVLSELDSGRSLKLLTKPILNLYQGIPGARQWRQLISRPQAVGLEAWSELMVWAEDRGV